MDIKVSGEGDRPCGVETYKHAHELVRKNFPFSDRGAPIAGAAIGGVGDAEGLPGGVSVAGIRSRVLAQLIMPEAGQRAEEVAEAASSLTWMLSISKTSTGGVKRLRLSSTMCGRSTAGAPMLYDSMSTSRSTSRNLGVKAHRTTLLEHAMHW